MTAATEAASGPAGVGDLVAALGTVLTVWAHPDDECYLAAGLMALAAEAGNRVVCVTATRGERGTPDPATYPPERLAAIRTIEMATAMDTLGVADHRWLTYRDGECAVADPDAAVETVAELIAEVGPDTVVTFGPDGMTGHPDHRAVGDWVTRAVERHTSPARLLYATTTAAAVRRQPQALEAFDIWGPEGPPTTSPDQLALSLPLPPEVLDRKFEALRAQASQTAALIDHLGENAYRSWVAAEHFRAHRPATS
jgi:LmbE family N-acetylglucosaminyl deacetylase